MGIKYKIRLEYVARGIKEIKFLVLADGAIPHQPKHQMTKSPISSTEQSYLPKNQRSRIIKHDENPCLNINITYIFFPLPLSSKNALSDFVSLVLAWRSNFQYRDLNDYFGRFVPFYTT